MDVSVRGYRSEDAEATARIFFEAVSGGTAAHYTPAQRRAWLPAVPDLGEWRERLAAQQVWIAEAEAPIGFMTLAAAGYIDLAFVLPAHAGRGVAGALYQPLEQAAIAAGERRLHTMASWVAKPFFERRGFRVVRKNAFERDGVLLENFTMEKPLSAG